MDKIEDHHSANKIVNFIGNKKNRTFILLILTSGIVVGAGLNISFGLSIFNLQGILGAIVALIVVLLMS